MAHTPESRARDMAKRYARRFKWLAENGPCKCGSWARLEVDHLDPANKIGHALWSWSEERRTKELAKCQALCHTCHRLKTAEHYRKIMTGVRHLSKRKLTDKQVMRAKEMRDAGITTRVIAIKFGVNHVTIVKLTNAIRDGALPSSRGVLLG